jgi:hypothetical protein
MGGEPLLTDRHANTRRYTLAQRPAGSFHAGNPVILGMPGSLAVELAKTANIIQAGWGTIIEYRSLRNAAAALVNLPVLAWSSPRIELQNIGATH